MKKKKAALLLVTILSVVAFPFSGCGGERENNKSTGIEFKGYPIEGDRELSYFMDLSTSISSQYDNFGETEFAKELEKRTGIKVTYIHPVSGQGEQMLSLMIASDELPDMVEANWITYQGGPAKTISEETITELNPYMDQYAKNLKKYLKENPDVDKMVKTDEGQYYAFPFVRGDKLLLCSRGPVIRMDWLEELNLDVPKTVEEFENVLREFKKKGADTPLSCVAWDSQYLLSLAGSANSFYLEDGKVKYAPITEEYKNALITLNRWYEEGLLDGNFLANDTPDLHAGVLNDKVGVAIGSGGGDIGTWYDSTEDKNFRMVGMPNLLRNDGTPGYFNIVSKYPGNGCVAISASCKNPDIACLYLDYGYSEEGSELYNYGIEGTSYKIEDGKHVYTDEIFHNPDKLTMAQAMGNYMRAQSQGPFVQQKDYILNYYHRDAQRESLENWLKYYDQVTPMILPPISFTEEEAGENADILSEVDKYVSKMRSEFIMGTTDIGEFDNYVAKLEKLNVQRLIDIREEALVRYNKH